MLSILLATVLSFAPQGGTVFTADGGRVRGTVLDDGAAGVVVQLADGSTRTVRRAQIVRIELADGTALRPARSETPAQTSGSSPAPAPAQPAAPPSVAVPVPIAVAAPAAPASTLAPAPAVAAPPAAAAPPVAVPSASAAAPLTAAPPVPAVAPVAPAPPAAAMAPAAMPPAVPVATAAPAPPPAARASPLVIPPERLDTIHLARGGRVRCLVVEEGADGVVARLVDGTERRFAPGQVTRVDWADGTRSEVLPAAAPAAP